MSENKDYVTKEDYKELKKKFREERKQEKKQNRVDKKIEKIENKLAALRGEEGELKEEKKEEYHPVEEKREEHHHHHQPVEEKKVYYAYRKREGDDDKGKYYAYREQPGITRRVTIRPANYVIVDKKDTDTVSSTTTNETEKQSDLSEEDKIPKGQKISVPLPFDSNDDASPGFAPENEPERVPLSDPAPNEPIPEREPKY